MTTNQLQPSVIFTMGPSTEKEDILTAILSENVSYVRFNMSHASQDEHRARLALVRAISKKLNKDIKVFADLCGPKIRVTKIHGEKMRMSSGNTVRIVFDTEHVSEYSFTISYSDLYLYVKTGTVVALDDGKILLSVLLIENKNIICNVVRGGELINEKGVNIVDTDIPINPFTEKDKSDAMFAIHENFDAIALSFVKKKDDVVYLQNFIKEHTDRTIPIIAKIETRQALVEIGSILEVVSMIMVARGDLGIEIPIEKIPITQKELVYVSNSRGIPAIVATEILKSMTKNPFPPRAEITDCIDALVDGASFIMLSDETTTGEYPVEAVKVMTSVIKEFIDNQKKYIPFEKK